MPLILIANQIYIMQLTGTIQERVDAAIAFAKAHNTYKYDHEKVSALYKKAGIPYTKAAENLYREWGGVFANILFFNEEDEHYPTVPIDFYVMFFDEEEAKKISSCYYGKKTRTAENKGNYINLFAKEAMKQFGEDTVPVAEGGYYYQGVVFVKPDGTIRTNHPDYDHNDRFWQFDSFRDFLCMELGTCNPTKVDKTAESVEVDGTLEECLNAEMEYFKAHGGYKNCRLRAYNHHIIDIPKDRDLTDEELYQFLYDYFKDYEEDLNYCVHTVEYIIQ